MSLIALFLHCDLDQLVAVRTCPQESWVNWAERCMAYFNLALQNVSTARGKMQDHFEELVSRCSSMKDLRKLASCKLQLLYTNIKEVSRRF